MSCILTGSIAIDRIMNFPGRFKEHILLEKVHSLNVSFNISQYQEKRGGTAGNIAYTLTLFGEKPTLVAAVGNDFGLYRDYLQSIGLDTSYIEEFDDVVTASAHIITDQDDNQITGFIMGAMSHETHFALHSIPDPKQSYLVLSPGNKNDMLRYAAEASALHIKTIFDPGQTLPFLTKEEILTVLRQAHMLITNDYELQMIINRTGCTEEEIVNAVEFLITTFGKNGSTIRSKDVTVDIPICPVANAVDPTGAGDAYRAGLIKGLSMDCDLESIGRMAAVAGAYAVEHYGTQEHHFTIDQFCSRYKEAFNAPCPLQ